MKHYKILFLFLAFLYSFLVYPQNDNLELNELISKGLNNNKGLNASLLKVKASKANINSAYDFDKTSIYYGRDQNNIAPNDKPLNVFGVQQTFAFPTVYGVQRGLNKSLWEQEKIAYDIQKNQLILEIAQLYENIVYMQHKEKLYAQLDSLYTHFSKAGNRKFELGETNYLEKITAEAKSKQIRTTFIQIQKQKLSLLEQLTALIQSDERIEVTKNELELLFIDNFSDTKLLLEQQMEAISKTYASQLKLQNHNWLPDLNVEFFTGTNKGLGHRLNGFQVGVSIPLFFSGNISKRKVAKFEQQSWESMKREREIRMNSFYLQKQMELEEQKEMIKYYEENGKHLSKEILKTANGSYQNGEIDFYQYIQSVESAIGIDVDYLNSVLAYNKAYLELYYFNFKD